MKMHKYYLHVRLGQQTLSLSDGAIITTLTLQDNQPVIYVLENDAPKRKRYLNTIFTGHDSNDGLYLGTYTQYGLVYHVFEEFLCLPSS